MSTLRDDEPPMDTLGPASVVEAALFMAGAHGAYVFPVDHPELPICAGIQTREHDPATCTKRGKHPCVKFSLDATNTARDIAKTFERAGGPRNYGINTRRSRLLVLDVDNTAKLESYLAAEGRTLAFTFTVKTHQGEHHYYRVTPEQSNQLSNAQLCPGVDVRAGSHGYVVGPGSRHTSGQVYEPVDWGDDIQPAPDWLVRTLIAKNPANREGIDGTPVSQVSRGTPRDTPGTPPLSSANVGTPDPAPVELHTLPEHVRLALTEAPSDRSATFHSVVGLLWLEGLTAGQIIALMKPWCARHGKYEGRVAAEVGRSLQKMRQANTSEAEPGVVLDEEEARAVREEMLLADRVRGIRRDREARRIVDAEEAKPKPFDDLTLAERLARPRAPKLHRIEGWQPANTRVVLAAQYKAGKTTLTGNLTRCLVDGDDWLGQYPVAAIDGAVAIVDLEMDAEQGESWLADQGIGHPEKVRPYFLRGNVAAFNILDPTVRTQWAERLSGHGIEYLIFDCLRPVLDALGLSEHTEAGRFLVAFDALLKEAGIAEACVVHHMGHIGSDDRNRERARGDSRIRDWPDVEWRLLRQDPDNPASPRYITAIGRDVEQSEAMLHYDPTTRHLSIAGGTRAAMKTSSAERFVLQVLNSARAGAHSRRSLSKFADAHDPAIPSRQDIAEAIARLVSRGVVTEVSNPRGSGKVLYLNAQKNQTKSGAPGAPDTPCTATVDGGDTPGDQYSQARGGAPGAPGHPGAPSTGGGAPPYIGAPPVLGHPLSGHPRDSIPLRDHGWWVGRGPEHPGCAICQHLRPKDDDSGGA